MPWGCADIPRCHSSGARTFFMAGTNYMSFGYSLGIAPALLDWQYREINWKSAAALPI